MDMNDPSLKKALPSGGYYGLANATVLKIQGEHVVYDDLGDLNAWAEYET